MSKVAGIHIGITQNDSFEIPAGQMGGKDQSVTIAIPNANVSRHEVAALTRHMNERSKNIKKSIKQLEALAETLVVDKETKTVIMDREFIKDLKDCIKAVKNEYEEMLKAAKNK